MNFDDLIKGGYVAIEELISSKTEERFNLEFKQKNSANDLDLHKDDRRALGEALSGFANATGGLLIIGIKTSKPNGIDRAEELKPITAVSAVADRYRAYVHECISPPISGVRISAIERPDGAGIILIDVPAGNARPHMSMAPGHQRYYRRVSDNFVPMQHYEIDEMMRIKTSPSLEFIWKIAGAGSIGGNRNFYFLFGLRNTSKMTAKFPFVSYHTAANQPRISQYGLDGNGNTLWPKLGVGSSDLITFAGGADRVIHPGQEFFVSRLEYAEHEDSSFRYWGVSNLPEGTAVELKFDFGCEDYPTQTARVRLTAKALLSETG